MTCSCDLEHSRYVVAHSGACPHYPNPPQRVAGVIRYLTQVDSNGRRYFRLALDRPWQRLQTANDFAVLNKIVDLYR